MRRPVSEGNAVRSQIIDVLEAVATTGKVAVVTPGHTLLSSVSFRVIP